MDVFQSTPPVWGATNGYVPETMDYKVSIHAPRVGSDYSILRLNMKEMGFNPRPPCGERQTAYT